MTKNLLEEGADVECLSFDYGQKHRVRELGAAQALTEAWHIRHDVVDLTSVGRLLTSGLVSDAPVPEGHYAADTMKATVVPNRNMVMLSIAAAVAISRGMDSVGYAAHRGDHTIYPDCRPEFAVAMGAALNLADWHELTLLVPFIGLSKADIIRSSPYVPWAMTWSCYNGRELHCGRCGTCVERREAFVLSGVDDPTEYEKDAGDLASLLLDAL